MWIRPLYLLKYSSYKQKRHDLVLSAGALFNYTQETFMQELDI